MALRSALAGLSACLLLGCDGLGTAGPPASCSEAGVQCQLPEGPLGVCERSACAGGEAPPCFSCTPQH